MALNTARKIKPWITDAIELDLPVAITQFRKHLLLENYSIAQFLETSTDDRDSKFLVVAPKGYGRTLVLKLKRLAVLQAHGAHRIHLLPQDSLIDRPTGTPPIFDKTQVYKKSNDIQFWKTLWINSICISVLQAVNRGLLEKIDNEYTQRLSFEDVQYTACNIFSAMLNLDDADYYRTTKACAASLVAYYASIRRPIALFIDNIDDYFFPQKANDEEANPIYQSQSRQMWVLAQVGLADAIRELRDVNTHIKIYAALRKEALDRAYHITPNAQQLWGISVDLQYTPEEIREIFIKNIFLQKDRMASPKSQDPIERFVGEDNSNVRHPYTRRSEKFLDFAVRHSMGRPRELMFIGEAISKIDPPRPVERIRAAVFAGAKSSVLKHLEDMRSFIPVPYIDLFAVINKNVMTVEELSIVAHAYIEALKAKGINTNGHPFCALFRLGLLGVLERSPHGDIRQKFPRPDSLLLERNTEILPKSPLYLIHPALDEIINEMSGADYRLNFERVNIVGDALPWRGYRAQQYVAKGDIVRFSEVMQSVEYARIYPELFKEWATEACDGLKYHEVFHGDSIFLVDGSPLKIIQAAKEIAERLVGFTNFPREIRFGASAGPIEFATGADGRTVPTGSALRTAARIEPITRPGTLVSDDAFARGAFEFGLPPAQIRAQEGLEHPELGFGEGKFEIRKNVTDPSVATGLWEVKLLD